MIIPDYKTCVSAEREKFAWSATNYGYHQQAAWYCMLVRLLRLADDPVLVFVAQEKTPPYLVNVIQLDTLAIQIGDLLNRKAIGIYAACVESNRWPSYSEDVELAELPYWYSRKFEDELT